MTRKTTFLKAVLGSSSIIWYDLEILHQGVKSVETKSQKVFMGLICAFVEVNGENWEGAFNQYISLTHVLRQMSVKLRYYIEFLGYFTNKNFS